MNDDDFLRRAVAPFKQVEASAQLRHAVTNPPSPSRLVTARPRLRLRPRPRAGGIVAALAVAVAAVVLVTDAGERRADQEPTGQRLDISGAREVVFDDGLTVDLDELFDSTNFDRLEAMFRDHGVELVIDEVPVNPAADGRVYSMWVEPDTGAEDFEQGVIRLQPGARVYVEVGRADESAGMSGLTLYEVFPEIEAVLNRDDPVATGQALRSLGFDVRWVLIEGAGRGHDVPTPPPDTVVISVLGPNGEWTSIDPATDTLMVEVASPAVADELGH